MVWLLGPNDVVTVSDIVYMESDGSGPVTYSWSCTLAHMYMQESNHVTSKFTGTSSSESYRKQPCVKLCDKNYSN